MLTRRVFAPLLMVLAAALAAPTAAAETRTEARFDVAYRGIKAGEVIFKGVTTAGSYGVAGVLRSTGLLRAVANLRYDARSSGLVNENTFVPVSYDEQASIGQRNSTSVMRYDGGVPVKVDYAPDAPPEPYHLDPRTQGGTLDPASAVFFMLRDLPREQACNGSVFMFDGRRRSRLAVVNPRLEGDRLVCDGEYRRIAGFPAEELQERTAFPFSVIYRPAGSVYQVERVTIQTTYGPVRLNRR
jgi:hypothetical protein